MDTYPSSQSVWSIIGMNWPNYNQRRYGVKAWHCFSQFRVCRPARLKLSNSQLVSIVCLLCSCRRGHLSAWCKQALLSNARINSRRCRWWRTRKLHWSDTQSRRNEIDQWRFSLRDDKSSGIDVVLPLESCPVCRRREWGVRLFRIRKSSIYLPSSLVKWHIISTFTLQLNGDYHQWRARIERNQLEARFSREMCNVSFIQLSLVIELLLFFGHRGFERFALMTTTTMISLFLATCRQCEVKKKSICHSNTSATCSHVDQCARDSSISFTPQRWSVWENERINYSTLTNRNRHGDENGFWKGIRSKANVCLSTHSTIGPRITSPSRVDDQLFMSTYIQTRGILQGTIIVIVVIMYRSCPSFNDQEQFTRSSLFSYLYGCWTSIQMTCKLPPMRSCFFLRAI